MKIAVFNGSPRKENTAAMVEAAIQRVYCIGKPAKADKAACC